MSTRWYPLYQRGGPQLRVFLPNFWLKLVRPTTDQPENVVQFSCSMEMTKYDIRNYLEKIYNIKIMSISTRIALGKTTRHPYKGYVIKAEDIKYAYITLPKEEKFVFPELYPDNEDAKKEEENTIAEVKGGLKKYLEKNKERPNMPGWYSI